MPCPPIHYCPRFFFPAGSTIIGILVPQISFREIKARVPELETLCRWIPCVLSQPVFIYFISCYLVPPNEKSRGFFSPWFLFSLSGSQADPNGIFFSWDAQMNSTSSPVCVLQPKRGWGAPGGDWGEFIQEKELFLSPNGKIFPELLWKSVSALKKFPQIHPPLWVS